MSTIKDRLLKEYWIEKATRLEEYPFSEHSVVAKDVPVAFETVRHEIPKEYIQKVNDLAGGNKITTFITYISFFNILLSKYYSQKQVAITSPPFRHDDLTARQNSLNFFSITNEPADTVKQVLTNTKNEVIETLNHQQFDLEDLIDHLGRNDIAYHAIYQVGFDIKNITQSSIPFDQISLRMELDLESDEQIAIHYNSEIFETYFIKQLGAHFVHCLKAGLNDLDVIASSLPLLTSEEREHILVQFNNFSAPFPRDKSIVDIFEEQVIKSPDSIAISYDGTPCSYAELNQRANNLANYLVQNCDLSLDDKVALFLDRSDHFIVSLLGILKAGGVYVPIDTGAPSGRIEFILEDAKPKTVITISEHIFNFEDYKGNLLSLDIQEDAFEKVKANLEQKVKPDHSAYVMYTSGTTGKPKGVLVAHRNVVRLVKNTNYVEIDQNSSMIMTGSVAFDATTYEIWGALLNGATLHILSRNNLMDIGIFKSKVHELGITHMWFTTSWFNQLVTTDIDLFEHLDYLVVGGEKTSPKYFNAVRALSGKIKIRHVYGPTENTTYSTYYAIEAPSSQPFPIGKPIANSTAYILDEHGEPSPIGVEGEIYLGGEGIAKGYLNKPELTKQKFVPDTFTNEGMLYRTGDRGKWDRDGNIEFIGRKDNQIKLRGFRIELDEIGNILNSHSDINEAVVTYTKKGEEDGYLTAYIISDKKAKDLSLKDYLEQYFPDYMVPSYFLNLETIPLTINGKLDYRALPDAKTLEGLGAEYVAPQGRVQEALVEIWKEILNKDRIGINDDFFELGGHSLKATQLLMEIHHKLEVHIEIGHIFNHTTISELAEIVEESESVGYKPITPADKQEYYPLSHGQKRLWVLDQFEGEKLAYIIPRAFKLEHVDLDILERAFSRMIERHEVLRTTFIEVGDEPKQKINEPEDIQFKIQRIDLTETEDQNEALNRLSHREVSDPFDLEKGPLMRATLALLGDDHSVLFLTMHHIISDFWSSNVFYHEMITLYKGYSKVEHPTLVPLKIQYKDYAVWQHKQLSGDTLEKSKAYWKSVFPKTVPQLELPWDHPRPKIKTTNGAAVDINLPQALGQKLVKLNNEQESTAFNTLLTAIYAFLYRWSGQSDMVIGTPILGRDHKDLASQIGLYINSLAIRINQIQDKMSFSQLIGEVKEVTTEALNYQMYPFDLVVQDLDVKKDPSRSPLFDIMVQILNSEASNESNLNTERESVDGFKQKITTSSFDMIFDLVVEEDNIRGVIKYNTDLFEEESMIILRSRFYNFLEGILNNPETEIDRLNFKTDEEAENSKVVLSQDFDF